MDKSLEDENFENEKSTSPQPLVEGITPPVYLDFPEAIREVIKGKKITRQDWANQLYWGELSEGRLKLHKPDGKYHDWIVSDGDLDAEDWYILNQ